MPSIHRTDRRAGSRTRAAWTHPQLRSPPATHTACISHAVWARCLPTSLHVCAGRGDSGQPDSRRRNLARPAGGTQPTYHQGGRAPEAALRHISRPWELGRRRYLACLSWPRSKIPDDGVRARRGGCDRCACGPLAQGLPDVLLDGLSSPTPKELDVLRRYIAACIELRTHAAHRMLGKQVRLGDRSECTHYRR